MNISPGTTNENNRNFSPKITHLESSVTKLWIGLLLRARIFQMKTPWCVLELFLHSRSKRHCHLFLKCYCCWFMQKDGNWSVLKSFHLHNVILNNFWYWIYLNWLLHFFTVMLLFLLLLWIWKWEWSHWMFKSITKIV